MKTVSVIQKCAFILLALALGAVAALPAHAQGAAQPVSALTVPAANLMQPEDLNKLLRKPQTQKPLILQVGSRVMFDEAHIVGAEYAGPGSHDDGLQMLRNRVDSLSRQTSIVIYCGCCPWNRCPNIGPAFKLLSGMGFAHLKVLYIADDFGTDWVNMGYPAEPAR